MSCSDQRQAKDEWPSLIDSGVKKSRGTEHAPNKWGAVALILRHATPGN